MKLQFDKNQAYQLEAIKSVIDIFEGQTFNSTENDFLHLDSENDIAQTTQHTVANHLSLSNDDLLVNLHKTQKNNEFPANKISVKLEKLWYSTDDDFDEKAASYIISTEFPNYSVEMETGTGKTYVYLRSIYELNKNYGFKKFIIVVPSVAIREGVLKSLQITAEHLQEIYEKQLVEYKIYNPGKVADLRNFAKSNAIQILIINIDSFSKDANIINLVRESGIKPIDYIKNCNPIVIMDEPQNMETNMRKKAIANLNPLCTLRYSATHKNQYNLIYKLDPVQAYDLGLVKQIEVDSVLVKNDNLGAYIDLNKIISAKQSISVKITILINLKFGVQKKQVYAKVGSDLYQLSNEYEIYKTGFIVNKINAIEKYIEFSNGSKVIIGQPNVAFADEISREMIDATVENHFKKEKEFFTKGIKVLSIFFVDKVANYRSYDENGFAVKGKYTQWFEESFSKWQNINGIKISNLFKSEEVHDGYFSQDKGKLKDSKEGKSTKADDETFKLIMQDKERLLNMDTPLRFIFSHSALREGWDNPNVFQICTLNETKSDIKKRQEIGRGLRLCVNQNGERILDRNINRLTIIANESYESFSKALQSEIKEQCEVEFDGRIKNARERVNVTLKNNWHADELFLEFWNKIKYKTEYQVNYDTQDLITKCVAAIKLMPFVDRPAIFKEHNIVVLNKNLKSPTLKLQSKLTISDKSTTLKNDHFLPDFVTYIQAKTELTRDTINKIILSSERLSDIFNNPQLWMDKVVAVIKNILEKLIIENIKYEIIEDKTHDITMFQSAESEQYLDNLILVKNQSKTLYNYITINPHNIAERNFVAECENNTDILFYFKFPKAFQINTPSGFYCPGWALIKKGVGQNSLLFYIVDIKNMIATKTNNLSNNDKNFAEVSFKSYNDLNYKCIAESCEI